MADVNQADVQYHEALKKVIGQGDVQFEPRTQQHIIGISSCVSTYDLREGFPLLTTKNVPPRLPLEEGFWKLRGERNVKPLVDRNVHIWTANAFDKHIRDNGLEDQFPKHSKERREKFEEYSEKIANDPEFAEKHGDLGSVYGFQLRSWPKYVEKEDGVHKEYVDQLQNIIEGIIEKPASRYHEMSSWNVGDLEKMAIGPCPFWHQFTIYGDKSDLTSVQRSDDIALGDPFNMAQEAMLHHLVSKETGLEPRYFHHQRINTHAYLGVPPRSNFWEDEKNVRDFQNKFNEIKKKSEYLDLKEEYLKNAPSESEGNEGKDHMPYLLTQLSKEPQQAPTIQIADMPMMDLIQKPVYDVIEVKNYNPHKWNSKMKMAD